MTDCLFLGTRGSAPCLRTTHKLLGGETSCVQVSGNQKRILIDAGTGITHINPSENSDFILLSHLHIDHLLGLADFAARKKNGELHILSAIADSGPALEALIGKVYGPPGYPVSIRQIYPNVKYGAIAKGQTSPIGGFQVTPLDLNHPGGSFGLRVRDPDTNQSLAYISDHEHGSDKDATLLELCQGLDLIVWDSSYDDRTFAKYRGWGHSTWQQGLAFAQSCGAKTVALTHHDFTRSDDVAKQIEAEFEGTIGLLAKDGLTLNL
jgi:phosphoribosyl 1,2-cyclic phosphodiesterase